MGGGGKITAQKLLELLSYQPDTGLFLWRVRRTGAFVREVGDIAGRVNKGRIEISLLGKRYQTHRLAWLYMTGNWPEVEIDHVDGNPMNNRFSNLRDVSHKTNLENQRKAQSHNSSAKYLGVSAASHGGFRARIKNNGKEIYLGCFKTQEEARDAYLSAKRQIHSGCMI